MEMRSTYYNNTARDWVAPPFNVTAAVERFHRQLPDYRPTRLLQLDKSSSSREGILYLKDESDRFGLPSFKILGASWGTFRALVQRYELPLDATIEAVKEAASSKPVVLHAATDGNHGRAVARVGNMFGLKAIIYVPRAMNPSTIDLIRSEGAEVIELTSSYDEAVLTAYRAANEDEGVLIQDTAFEGYEEVPKWIVQGYSTMLREIDDTLSPVKVDWIITPVGVGSLAQAVVSHSKQRDRSTKVMAVEPDTAACLHESLRRGHAHPIDTSPTIIAGMDCGTVSSIAWPLLRDGVDVSVTISDREAHAAVEDLGTVAVGPCGAAPLAALNSLSREDRSALDIDRGVTVLLCTEGARQYQVPD